MTTKGRPGIGIPSRWANIPAPTLMPRSIGSPARIGPTTPPTRIPVRQFVGPACVIDVSKEVAQYEDFLLTREHVQAWEGEHGKIAAGSWLLLRTDWSKRQGREAFLNAHADGAHSPGFQPDCVRFLAHERDVLGVGVETVGTDAGQAATFDPPFPAHNIMQGNGKFGLASLCNLDQLPPTGAVVIAAPLENCQRLRQSRCACWH